tara:strand:- start:8896 stop:9270 length:375 start_codon:yes stop_codon:yes gene_type:complete
MDDTDLEPDHFQEITSPIAKAITEWISEQKQNIVLLSSLKEADNDTHNNEKTPETLPLGICIRLKSKFKLKEPLNFLYSLAKVYKCEFVIAMSSEDTGALEDVCYFGYEEGRPELFEIANYLSL